MTDTTRKPRTRRDFLRMAALLPAALMTAGTAAAFPEIGEFSNPEGSLTGGPQRKKVARKKATRRKTTRKKATRKKATRKKATRKKTARKKTVRKKTARKKAARKKASRRSFRDYTESGFGGNLEQSVAGYDNFGGYESFTRTPSELPREADVSSEFGRWLNYGDE